MALFNLAAQVCNAKDQDHHQSADLLLATSMVDGFITNENNNGL